LLLLSPSRTRSFFAGPPGSTSTGSMATVHCSSSTWRASGTSGCVSTPAATFRRWFPSYSTIPPRAGPAAHGSLMGSRFPRPSDRRLRRMCRTSISSSRLRLGVCPACLRYLDGTQTAGRETL